MNTANKDLVNRFIKEIWNENQFEKMDHYFHPEFVDHSLPSVLLGNAIGLIAWIKATGEAFTHETVIEEIVSEDDKVMIKIRMLLKHKGTWRGIAPTGQNITATGYRFMKIKELKIIESWALMDGQAIENQLKEATGGCRGQA